LSLTAQDLRNLPAEQVREALESLTSQQRLELQYNWRFWARPDQIPPEGDWNTFLALAGRGWGKTRAAAEWVRDQVKSGKKRLAYVCATNSDIEKVFVKGDSGILNCTWEGDKNHKGVVIGRPFWSPTKRTLFWYRNGVESNKDRDLIAKVECFSAEEPERLRGPQFESAACFVAGTLVETSTGKKPVESIRPKDLVLTTTGLHQVINTSQMPRQVGKTIFSDGSYLEGTEEHPIYTQRGWVALSELKLGDEVWKLSAYTTMMCGSSVQTGTTPMATRDSTERLPETTWGKLMGMISTTLMGIKQTITQATSKNSQDQSISNSIIVRGVSQKGNLWEKEKPLVLTAEKNSSVNVFPWVGRSAYLANVNEKWKSRKKFALASNAAKSSGHTQGLCVVSVASTWQPTAVKTVYNLHVETTQEYYANGILTHNCDELCAWNKDKETWDMLQFCLRLGKHPKVFIATTPKSTALLREIMKNEKTIIVSGSTYDNADNLASTYIEKLKADYEGTRLGKQEIYAEVLTENEGSLWTAEMVDRCQIERDEVPDLQRVVISVDHATTSNTESDETGIIVAGLDYNGVAYILEDHTFKGLPEEWASKAIELYYKEYFKCSPSKIIYEKNQGGDLIPTLVRTIDDSVPLRGVFASNSKIARAEPVSSLYERNMVKHVRNPENGQSLTELETQMTTFEPLGKHKSPDRYDAMVWALTDLKLKGRARPKLGVVAVNKDSLSEKEN